MSDDYVLVIFVDLVYFVEYVLVFYGMLMV